MKDDNWLTIAVKKATKTMASRSCTTAVARTLAGAASRQSTRSFSAVVSKVARPSSREAQIALKTALNVSCETVNVVRLFSDFRLQCNSPAEE